MHYLDTGVILCGEQVLFQHLGEILCVRSLILCLDTWVFCHTAHDSAVGQGAGDQTISHGRSLRKRE